MKKPVLISLAFAFTAVILFIILKSANIIALNCPFSYLNPWQYFFYCSGFSLVIYLAIFLASFTAAFLILKKKK
jgi:hypothetical protein